MAALLPVAQELSVSLQHLPSIFNLYHAHASVLPQKVLGRVNNVKMQSETKILINMIQNVLKMQFKNYTKRSHSG